MFKILLVLVLFFNIAIAKKITPNEVYAQVGLIQDEIHHLLKYYGLKHNHDTIQHRLLVKTPLKPRNVWQKTYEIMIKINILNFNMFFCCSYTLLLKQQFIT